jgi:protein tyrosine phosphatase (PTP) superfamily phosphohydrolase (DUF442 family)
MLGKRSLFALLLPLLSGLACQPQTTTAPQTALEPAIGAKVEAAGLHNVYRITEKLYSGSSPDGDEGFRSLEKLGVKTIISVDGMKPDVEAAHKHGMRYVHLPIGYDGVPEDTGWKLARAVRDLPGPVYIHCHHGQHRGPAAAAVVHLCLDDKCSLQTALEEMRRAGTDPHYAGLYASPQQLHRPSRADLDRVPAEFLESAPIPAFAEIMVNVDACWDRIKAIRAAGWKTPPDHPDVEPAHEALQLREHFHEAGRLPATGQRPDDFRGRLADAEQAAQALETALRDRKDQAAPDVAFQKSAASCTQCHVKYRDVPPAR